MRCALRILFLASMVFVFETTTFGQITLNVSVDTTPLVGQACVRLSDAALFGVNSPGYRARKYSFQAKMSFA